MSTIAFVPVRAGSKSIHKKNIKRFCGKPLVYWTLMSLQSSKVDKIIIASDCSETKSIVNLFNLSKIEIYDRKSENATDNASTESVILEYINQSKLLDTDTLMLVQVTSPFTQTIHFNEGLDLFKKYDSILSCAVDKKFFWKEDGVPINYNIYNRPRRQDWSGNLIENGAFYINSIKNIIKHKNRISGNIGIYKMPDYTIVEIDNKLDWLIAESIMRSYVLNKGLDNFSNIKIVFSDVDGVLTDASMYYAENGNEFKKFNAYDGMAFKLLQDNGYKVGIITSEDMQLNRNRAKKLRLDFDFHGILDKLAFIKKFCEENCYSLDEIAYIGDDINCHSLLSSVGVSACPINAIEKIKLIPNIIHLNSKGGDGVFREFVELILNQNNETAEKY
ncbi:MAG: acylneuraminate cytidylyltransferase [Flavobacteriales bacterium]|nr:acylneuraminate cytidylyltransferase [Flavobacteriales bacterium]